jgi:hypothetical protein
MWQWIPLNYYILKDKLNEHCELVVHNINIMSMILLGVKYHILHLDHVIEFFWYNALWNFVKKEPYFFGNVVENKIFIYT